jgi:hypothetical protein
MDMTRHSEQSGNRFVECGLCPEPAEVTRPPLKEVSSSSMTRALCQPYSTSLRKGSTIIGARHTATVLPFVRVAKTGRKRRHKQPVSTEIEVVPSNLPREGALDQADLRLLADFFLLLKKWDTLQSTQDPDESANGEQEAA